MQYNIPSHIKREDLVNVIYAPLNFKDIMLATGKIQTMEFYFNNSSDLLGFEFVGLDVHGQRLMGMCLYG